MILHLIITNKPCFVSRKLSEETSKVYSYKHVNSIVYNYYKCDDSSVIFAIGGNSANYSAEIIVMKL